MRCYDLRKEPDRTELRQLPTSNAGPRPFSARPRQVRSAARCSARRQRRQNWTALTQHSGTGFISFNQAAFLMAALNG